MAYSSGGLITATDYNGLASTNSANIAWVMGTGFGDAGYGQDTSSITSVSATQTVTATQWAGLFFLLNRALGHQGGTQIASGNLNATAGSTITYFANVSTAVTTINTNKLSWGSQGTTSTGTTFWSNLSSITAGYTGSFTRKVAFSSVNAARYFFNAGGQLNLILTSPTDNNSGISNSLEAVYEAMGGISAFRYTTNGGRTGTGLTQGTNLTSHGYYDNSTTPTEIQRVTDTTANYTTTFCNVQVLTDDSTTTNGSKGASVLFRVYLSAQDKTWDDNITITLGSRVDIVFPETTYLTNSWGTPTIT